MTKKAAVAQLREHEKYERLVTATKDLQPLATAVAHPCDETSLRGALEAAEAGIIAPILVGPEDRISSLANSLGLDIEGIDIVDVPHSQAAAAKAVEIVRTGKAREACTPMSCWAQSRNGRRGFALGGVSATFS
jgi:phosphate acetyltransferase